MSITANLERISTAKENIKNKLIEKGVDVPANARLDEFPDMFDNIVAGDPGDWADIGYAAPPQYIADGIAYAKEIYDNWEKTIYNQVANFKFDKERMVFFPKVDVSPVQDADWFLGNCKNLVYVPQLNFSSNNKTFSNFFYNCSKLEKIVGLGNWDTSNVTSMGSMFSGCSSLTTLDISNWDTSNVTYMQSMFSGCSSLTTLDISNWDTSNVTSMQSMFSGCSSLTTLDISNWDISNVTTSGLDYMFNGCSSLTTLDISNWDTSNVTRLQRTFANCASLISLDLSKWNTSKVDNLEYTFYNCTALKFLDLSNWDTSNVKYFNDFCRSVPKDIRIRGCISIKGTESTYVTIGSWFLYSGMTEVRNFTIKDIGGYGSATYASFSFNISCFTNWGVNNDDEPNARQSVIDTLITYSLDRVEAGYTGKATITLSANTKALLTEDEIAQITAKGYTIA